MGTLGPNTGGSGAYSPAPVVTDAMMSQIEREILVPVVDCMKSHDTPYKGGAVRGAYDKQREGPRGFLEFTCSVWGPGNTADADAAEKSDLLEACPGCLRTETG